MLVQNKACFCPISCILITYMDAYIVPISDQFAMALRTNSHCPEVYTFDSSRFVPAVPSVPKPQHTIRDRVGISMLPKFFLIFLKVFVSELV